MCHHAQVLRVVHIVLIQNNLVVLVDDLEPLLLALISTYDTQLPRVLIGAHDLFRLVDEVDALVVGPA